MRYLIVFLIIVVNLYAWETNTHRAIDQTALKSDKVVNLINFVDAAGIGGEKYGSQIFEGYTNKDTGKPITYFDYFNTKYSDDAMAEWDQTFNNKYNYQDLIEAGTMLEDAVWEDEDTIAFGGDGRFNNHFYEAQNNGHKLTYGYGFHVNAVDWATDLSVPTANPNLYNYSREMRYFKLGFTESDPKVRRKYQAKILVSVGHLMHMVNDMKEGGVR
jgi:hypothetical protein